MQLGFFFTILNIAATLQRNGGIMHRPNKQFCDAVLAIYEMTTSGLNSYRGHHLSPLLNQAHRHSLTATTMSSSSA